MGGGGSGVGSVLLVGEEMSEGIGGERIGELDE